MAPFRSFVFYNNKGGVGKTTLAFNYAVEIAHRFPEKTILALDLDSQCNFSSLCLGGGSSGQTKVVDRQVLKTGRNIKTVLQATFRNERPHLADFAENCVVARNSATADVFPRNFELLCGSLDIDNYASTVELKANTKAVDDNMTPYADTYGVIKLLLEELSDQYIVIIDTNPSFSILTKIGLVACEELIIPTLIDELSKGGIEHLMTQLGFPNMYGNRFGAQAISMFATQLRQNEVRERNAAIQTFGVSESAFRPELLGLAKIRTIAFNRIDVSNQSQASVAVQKSIVSTIARGYLSSDPSIGVTFAKPHLAPGQQLPMIPEGPGATDEDRLAAAVDILDDFYVSEVPEAKSSTSVSQNLGIGISRIDHKLQALVFGYAERATVALNRANLLMYGIHIQNLVELSIQSNRTSQFAAWVKFKRKAATTDFLFVMPMTAAQFRGSLLERSLQNEHTRAAGMRIKFRGREPLPMQITEAESYDLEFLFDDDAAADHGEAEAAVRVAPAMPATPAVAMAAPSSTGPAKKRSSTAAKQAAAAGKPKKRNPAAAETAAAVPTATATTPAAATVPAGAAVALVSTGKPKKRNSAAAGDAQPKLKKAKPSL